jgi:hypothetical protein
VSEICGNSFEDEGERNPNDAPDLPPEFCRYKDEGCELAESCLKCPFPRCIYDEPRGKQRWLRQVRDHEIKKRFVKGTGTKELGIMFGLSRRTVQRALKNVAGGERRQNDQSEEKGKGRIDE